ncbi:MAG: VCBS repeat-containing protein [Reichenbachiella sp.]
MSFMLVGRNIVGSEFVKKIIEVGSRISIIILILFLFNCTQDELIEQEQIDSKQVRLFDLVSKDKSNIDFENKIIENNRINILNYFYYYNGSGIATGDINNDGLPDIYFVATTGKNKLYLNKGNLVFEDITASANASGSFGITSGVSFVDINNDGFLDIYLCKSGNNGEQLRTNQLLINNGKLGFVEQASEFNLDDHSFSSQSYFFDMDSDGDLDMYLVNHPIDWVNRNKILTGDQNFEGFDYQYSDKLYRNNGDYTFSDITEKAGVLNRSWGLSASIGDFTGDGLMDIYVANDFIKPDNLYVNNGDGTFTDRMKEYFRHISMFSMGTDYADINNDGMNDLYVLDMAMNGHIRSKKNMGSMSTENFQKIIERGYHYPYAINTLHLNNGNGTPFSEIAQMSGVAKTDWSWSPLLVDLDNDGYKDIFVTNGIYRDIIDNDFIVKKSIYDSSKNLNYYQDLLLEIPQTEIKNFVFQNNQDLTFSDLSSAWGIDKATNANGSTYADLDGDGDMDIITNNLNEPSSIYENKSNEVLNNNFIKVRLEGSLINTFAVGSIIEIHAEGNLQRQDLMPFRGYLSSSEYIVNFGLGQQSKIDSLVVTWPDGKVTTIENPDINELTIVEYDDAEEIKYELIENNDLFIDHTQDLGLTFQHEESVFNDFINELLLPHKFSENGPFVSVADVNLDGLDDFYIGGAAGIEGALFVQKRTGGFSRKSQDDWSKDKMYEDQKSIFFDADGDEDLDLYIVSGSNEFTKFKFYQDRLYLNDGKGNFKKSIGSLPKITASGMDVAAGDYDNDGDLDLVVGGRVVPGKYPTSPKSYLLRNDGGKFKDVTKSEAPGLSEIGMVTSIEFIDYDNDHDLDLAIVGEWMPITILVNSGSNYLSTEGPKIIPNSKGWWMSLTSSDLDLDGDMDLIAGNIGKNNKYKPTSEKPLHVYYNDFDNNGTGDIVLSKKENKTNYPVRGLECSSEQMPFIKSSFPTFESFATASLEDIYSLEVLKNSLHFETEEFGSCVFLNNGKGEFTKKLLPNESQVSALLALNTLDFNKDAIPDLIGGGNIYSTETETVRYDASSGVILIGNGNGSFDNISIDVSGFDASGNVKDVKVIKLVDGSTGLLIARNRGSLSLWSINNDY